ncbi:hypothetical protein JVU11DRAFT_2852 [Chiua virens]|nr:hypothetical protein JVU11DRAFT_2852 [Chiua virens]
MLFSRCAALTNFALAVDFRDVDKSPSTASLSRLGDVVTTHCSRADFVTSVINYPATIAAFLSDICPKLKRVTSHMDDSGEWEEVNRLLPLFFAVRSQHLDSSGGR